MAVPANSIPAPDAINTEPRTSRFAAIDCGTNSIAEVAWLREQGVDCIIVDHHEPGASRPDCIALVNPRMSESNFMIAFL
mgnify:CR=1 FL=1